MGQPVECVGVEKMSKSKRNTVAPEEIFDRYGADAARLFRALRLPAPERDVQWTESGVEGSNRFVQRVWAEVEAASEAGLQGEEIDPDLERVLHKLIKQAGDGLDALKFNAVIALYYGFLNTLRRHREDKPQALTARAQSLKAFIPLIAPYTPHLAEAAWEKLGGEGMVVDAPWPDYDPALAIDEEAILPVQVNGKRRSEIRAPRGASEADVRALAMSDPETLRHLEGLTVRKVIVVPDRIVNIVAA